MLLWISFYTALCFAILEVGMAIYIMVSISNIKAVSDCLSEAINKKLGNCSYELIPITRSFLKI